ncbi:MAG: hypothetical protein HYT78_09430 [Deltaproteobacteria bacterium]|nr:hypothetical protein [Deltaproteobacteria bacterium]
MSVLLYWTHKCPHCGYPFATTAYWRGLGVRLGPGYHTCKNCHRSFDDGSKEWPEMSIFERFALFIPRVSWPFLILALLLPFISWMTQGGKEAARFALVTVVGLVVLLPVFLSPYWIYRIIQVRRSCKRFAGTPVREFVSPALAGWLVVVIAGLIIAAGMYGFIPNVFITRAIEESRSRAEAQLGRIEAIEGKLSGAAIRSEKWNVASITKATGVMPTVKNLAVMHRENLADLTRNLMYPRAMPVVLCNPYDTVAAASFVRKGKWPNRDSFTWFDSSVRVREVLDSLEQLRFLLVIRQTQYKPPVITRPGTFESGEYDADVLLFEIQSGRYLGGFKISAGNSFRIESRGKVDVETLENNLSVNAEQSLRGKLAEHLPNVKRDEQFCGH